MKSIKVHRQIYTINTISTQKLGTALGYFDCNYRQDIVFNVSAYVQYQHHPNYEYPTQCSIELRIEPDQNTRNRLSKCIIMITLHLSCNETARSYKEVVSYTKCNLNISWWPIRRLILDDHDINQMTFECDIDILRWNKDIIPMTMDYNHKLIEYKWNIDKTILKSFLLNQEYQKHIESDTFRNGKGDGNAFYWLQLSDYPGLSGRKEINLRIYQYKVDNNHVYNYWISIQFDDMVIRYDGVINCTSYKEYYKIYPARNCLWQDDTVLKRFISKLESIEIQLRRVD